MRSQWRIACSIDLDQIMEYIEWFLFCHVLRTFINSDRSRILFEWTIHCVEFPWWYCSCLWSSSVTSSQFSRSPIHIDRFSYRNFRTYTSPTPVQFSCVALDTAGEVVCAGGFDTFNIFVWSIKTGKLLDVRSMSNRNGSKFLLHLDRLDSQRTRRSNQCINLRSQYDADDIGQLFLG